MDMRRSVIIDEDDEAQTGLAKHRDHDPIPRIFYHSTRADLKPGDLIAPGYSSNYGRRKQASWVYLTSTLDAAIWGAELAAGDGRGGIYVVEPTGAIEDDPNLTDRKFPGNEARSHAGGMASTAVALSYRSREPLRVMGGVADWRGHSPERLKAMKDHLERLRQQGIEAID
jgi:hypothetical protein